MSMEFLSPQELQDALRKKAVKEPRPASFIVALVKQSDASDTLLVCQTGCADWIELPMKMVAKIKLVGSADCGSERYPVALIFLAAVDDPFARVAYKLLEQLGTTTRGGGGSGGQNPGGCGCKEGANQTHAPAARARNISVGRAWPVRHIRRLQVPLRVLSLHALHSLDRFLLVVHLLRSGGRRLRDWILNRPAR